MPIGIGIGICEDYADIRKKKLSEFQHCRKQHSGCVVRISTA